MYIRLLWSNLNRYFNPYSIFLPIDGEAWYHCRYGLVTVKSIVKNYEGITYVNFELHNGEREQEEPDKFMAQSRRKLNTELSSALTLQSKTRPEIFLDGLSSFWK